VKLAGDEGKVDNIGDCGNIAILYDHMIMYAGLFSHSAVVFNVFMFY